MLNPRRIRENLIGLYGIQAVQVLLPLLAFPYLARVLGSESWGRLLFLQAISAWIIVVVEFGFSISATRDIAHQKSNTSAVAAISSSVLYVQMLICFALFIVFIVAASIIPSINLSLMDVLMILGLAFSQAMLPIWYFQGLEIFFKILIVAIAAKVLNLILIFLLVVKNNDYSKVILIQTLTSLIPLFFGYHFIIASNKLMKFNIVDFNRVIVSGISMFFFKVSVSLYTTSNAIILGIFLSYSSLSNFLIADKLLRFAIIAIEPIGKAFFSFVNSGVKIDKEKLLFTIDYLLRVSLYFSLLIAIIIYAFSDSLISLIFGKEYFEASVILKIMAFSIPFIALSNILGLNWLIPLKLDKTFNILIFSGGLLNLIVLFSTINYLGNVSAAISLVFSEFFITLIMILMYLDYKRKVKYD